MLVDSIVSIEFKYKFSGNEECWDDGFMNSSNIGDTNCICVIGRSSDDGEDFEPRLIKLTNVHGDTLYCGEFLPSLGAVASRGDADAADDDEDDLAFVDILSKMFGFEESSDALFEMADIIDNMLCMMDSTHVINWVDDGALYSVGDDTINLSGDEAYLEPKMVEFYVMRSFINGDICDASQVDSFETLRAMVTANADADAYLNRFLAILGRKASF